MEKQVLPGYMTTYKLYVSSNLNMFILQFILSDKCLYVPSPELSLTVGGI